MSELTKEVLIIVIQALIIPLLVMTLKHLSSSIEASKFRVIKDYALTTVKAVEQEFSGENNIRKKEEAYTFLAGLDISKTLSPDDIGKLIESAVHEMKNPTKKDGV